MLLTGLLQPFCLSCFFDLTCHATYISSKMQRHQCPVSSVLIPFPCSLCLFSIKCFSLHLYSYFLSLPKICSTCGVNSGILFVCQPIRVSRLDDALPAQCPVSSSAGAVHILPPDIPPPGRCSIHSTSSCFGAFIP